MINLKKVIHKQSRIDFSKKIKKKMSEKLSFFQTNLLNIQF